MKIDIDPILEKAEGFKRVVLETREIPRLYVVRLASGVDYSVEFDDKSIAEFQPNKTVSEMINSWEEGLQREYDMYCKAVETGIHPSWKSQKKVLHPITGTWTGKCEEVDYIMNKGEIEGMKVMIGRAKAKLGKLSFVQIY
jgi:hypothetical protein